MKTWDRTCDLQESILNQYKVPKKKLSAGKPKQRPYSRDKDLEFCANFRPTNLLKRVVIGRWGLH